MFGQGIYKVIIIVLALETVSIFLFWGIAVINRNRINLNSLLKGILERTFITFALILGYPQALTLFAALKIATRIKDDSKISNDFYLVGNLVSVTLALLYSVLINKYILS